MSSAEIIDYRDYSSAEMTDYTDYRNSSAEIIGPDYRDYRALLMYYRALRAWL